MSEASSQDLSRKLFYAIQCETTEDSPEASSMRIEFKFDEKFTALEMKS